MEIIRIIIDTVTSHWFGRFVANAYNRHQESKYQK